MYRYNSVAAGTGGVVGPHYASSKSAMHGLVHWLASRYATDGIVRHIISTPLSVNIWRFPVDGECRRSRIDNEYAFVII